MLQSSTSPDPLPPPGRSASERPTAWWKAMLTRRAERMYSEKLDLSQPVLWESPAEQEAAIRYFNAAFRAEESGLRQAHELADEVAGWDPELADCLRLYGNEEGWHRELLTEFIAYLGGDIRPMGPTTRTFYKLYARADRMETIVLTNLMFETIGSATYRLTLRTARHPAVRQMLTILTRDESFHVPLNVHFLRQILRNTPLGAAGKRRLNRIYNLLYVALLLSAKASRRRAQRFDKLSFRDLAGTYAKQLGRLFADNDELGLRTSPLLLKLLGLSREDLMQRDDASAISIAAAEAAVDREQVLVTAL
jgi:hypothetical protein